MYKQPSEITVMHGRGAVGYTCAEVHCSWHMAETSGSEQLISLSPEHVSESDLSSPVTEIETCLSQYHFNTQAGGKLLAKCCDEFSNRDNYLRGCKW